MRLKQHGPVVALLCVLACTACALMNVAAISHASVAVILKERARPAAGSAPSEAEEVAASAREVLARLPAQERLGEIGDARLRRAVQAAYRAVVALAENREPDKLASLNFKFERAYTAVRREMGRQYHTCADNCSAVDGQPCQTRCKAARKTGCGCRMILFGCLVAECIF